MGKKDKKIEQLQDENDELAIELKQWQERFKAANGVAAQVHMLRKAHVNQIEMIKSLRDKLMEQDNWIQKANLMLKDNVEDLEKTSQDYKDFSEAINTLITKEQELQDVISTLKGENNALQEKFNNTHLGEKSATQREIEDTAFSYAILKNHFGISDDIKFVNFIEDLITENTILNAELDLVPYQLEKQRELCAKTYEYWSNIFDGVQIPLTHKDIPKHISHHIKTTRIPTPDDLGNPVEDEGMTYPEGQD